VQPGPLLFTKQPEMLYTIFASFLLANVFMIVVSMAVARGFGLVMKTNPTILYAFILVLSLIGAFAVRNNVADVVVCVGFGITGYLMQRFQFPTAPLVLGVILGPLAEGYFTTSISNYGTPTVFFARPVSAIIISVAFLFVIWSLLPTRSTSRRALKQESTA
jgi:putative tricarboxylic transport membrane protein